MYYAGVQALKKAIGSRFTERKLISIKILSAKSTNENALNRVSGKVKKARDLNPDRIRTQRPTLVSRRKKQSAKHVNEFLGGRAKRFLSIAGAKKERENG